MVHIKKLNEFTKENRMDESLSALGVIGLTALCGISLPATALLSTYLSDRKKVRKLNKVATPYMKDVAAIFSNYKDEIKSGKYPCIEQALKGKNYWDDWRYTKASKDFNEECRKLMTNDDYNKLKETFKKISEAIKNFEKQEQDKRYNSLWNAIFDAASSPSEEIDSAGDAYADYDDDED